MISLPGIAETATWLKKGPLRDFAQPTERSDAHGTTVKKSLTRDDVPVPALWKAALELVDLKAGGPGDKVAWWIAFTYKTVPCTLASEKFGVRLYVTTVDEDQAQKVTTEITKKVSSAVEAVEKMIESAAPNLFGQGHATVVNQHFHLRHAYEYFRQRALDPTSIETVTTERHSADGTFLGASIADGPARMQVNAVNDLVAAITAYLSLLEHHLVLALGFQEFDPPTDNLSAIIGLPWGQKYERILGKGGLASTYRVRLTEIVERWRNMYAHGGFEKKHTGSVYLHVQGVGPLPAGLTNVRSSPLFTLFPANPTDIADVFSFFDEFDMWLRTTLPEAMAWVESGLDVRFEALPR
ncbi:MAG: hypothetical protein U5N21_17995 [Rhodococcus sp. (in: high G+C Gram-positive bacteria)]|uniref:hypothetical protein n=1 Tax=Rhodococcoides fascians TaxID=1828 RepID=UPI002ADC0476|nr:hypothetical protein [Rhodococcus sp. (in: high G+C Gram-positive bacteria)]